MAINNILKIIYAVMVLISVALSIVVTIRSFHSKKKNGKSNQLDDTNFFISMLDKMVEYLSTAEKVYAAFKDKTKDYGEMKLNDVLSKIQNDYISSGRTFDKTEWTNIIDKVIGMTKVVNNDQYNCK